MSPVAETARVFTDAKTVDNRALNLAGVQPFRAVVARLLYKLRRGVSDSMTPELSRTGLLVLEDFLPPETFLAVEREADDFIDTTQPTFMDESSGTTEVRHFTLAGIDAERFPHLDEWGGDRAVLRLASAAERRKCRRFDGGSLLQHLTVGDYSEYDDQTDLHVDEFFNTHKIWLYLDDVSARNAALVYVPGSHLLDRVRLREEYRAWTSGSGKRSRRVSDAEVWSRGLERRVVSCRRNTLVVANTCGYHCRSVGEAGELRRALHTSFRSNPFPAALNTSHLKRAAIRWPRSGASR